MRVTLLFTFITASVISLYASDLANPSSLIDEANVSVGASYHLGGYTLTNLGIPALFNRIHGRVSYAPISYVNLGVDLGATQIDVDKYISTKDTINLFHGKYGFSGGINLKLATPPILKKKLSFISIAEATMFSSKDENNAKYGGYDGSGVIGLQVQIPKFGSISAGPMVYVIQGDARGVDGHSHFYSNKNNVRGWMAVDYYLKGNDLSNGTAYISAEFSISPEATYSDRIRVQEFSFSISLGYITGKLYGTDKEPK